MSEPKNSFDVLGIKPLGDAALVVTKASTDGAGAFLSRICLPAAEEFGFLLQDRVVAWRTEQRIKLTLRTERKYRAAFGDAERHAHPRLVAAVLENGSWEDDDQVQEMWAGLLASGCTAEGRSQDNLIFVGLLSSITASQAKVLAYACQNANKRLGAAGLPMADGPVIPRQKLFELFGSDDIYALDVAVDHLRELGLLAFASGMGFHAPDNNQIEPSPLALSFYARCEGHVGSVLDFYGLRPADDLPPGPETDAPGTIART
ncbi:hypothetical protein DJ021_17775 [Phenylobacterium hankyongense]|uniref:DUF4393 domain-containing protein n=1 Tax=Phenylobacterium hankyongense TaxID=1813876 RepID=A0A328B3T3_9CAUL|nr:hypothetical protein [Phenylobacterium hankyongense]RAK61517.1 hypothetical protein DJ021_17775 [Phenylobacterium hankyongense]